MRRHHGRVAGAHKLTASWAANEVQHGRLAGPDLRRGQRAACFILQRGILESAELRHSHPLHMTV